MSDIELTAEAFAQLKKENSKLKLEANLRRSLSSQLEKQKKIAESPDSALFFSKKKKKQKSRIKI